MICRQHLRAYFVVPVIQWDYLSDPLRVPRPTNPYSESLIFIKSMDLMKRRKTAAHAVLGAVRPLYVRPRAALHLASCPFGALTLSRNVNSVS